MNQPPTRPSDTGLTCPECDYNLTGITGDRCPWCGWQIEADALAASAAEKDSPLRWGVAGTAFLIGCGLLAALGSMLKGSRELSVWDAAAVLAVLLPAIGHLVLAGLATMSRRHWPMPHREARTILGFIAALAIVLAIPGAATALLTTPATRTVHGAQISNVLEFTVTALFWSLPACLLLLLRIVSFRIVNRGVLARTAKARGKAAGVPFSLEYAGKRGECQITQSWRDTPRPISPAVDRLITRTWEVEQALASQAGRSLYNGRLARLLHVEVSADGLHLLLTATCYRDFLGTNLHNAAEVSRFGLQYLADPLGISATVITRDGRLGLGRRSDRVAFHAGHLHTFGGLLEDPDRGPDGRYDIFGAARRELIEELGLEAAEIATLEVIGLVRDRAILQPELLFDALLTVTSDELAARFDPTLSDGEHTGVEWLPDDPGSIIPFLQRARPVAPVAEAALLLHGRCAWGCDWLERSCRQLYGALPRPWARPEGNAPLRSMSRSGDGSAVVQRTRATTAA